MNTKLEQAARQALGLLEKIHSNQQSAWNCLTEITALHAALEAVPKTAALEQESALIANDWSVFNTGAEVASGLSLNEAMDYLTDERAARGWSVVCVINKDNMPTPAHPPALVAAAEREECAKVCVDISKDYWMGDCQFEAATRCATAIRARNTNA